MDMLRRLPRKRIARWGACNTRKEICIRRGRVPEKKIASGRQAAATGPRGAAARGHAARGPAAGQSASSGSSVVLLITSMEKLALTSSRSTAAIRRR